MNNKIMKKEEVLELLKSARIILNNEMISYLESIINLEFSVVKDVISTDERKALTELQVYRSSLIYNIYNRDVKYFTEEYKKNNFQFFDFYINSNDVPSIKLFIKVPNSNFENDKKIQKQLELTRFYFEKLKNEYDLKDSALVSNKKFVKKLPGLNIKKEIKIG